MREYQPKPAPVHPLAALMRAGLDLVALAVGLAAFVSVAATAASLFASR